MNNESTLPAWIVFILIALGVALAVGIALLLTQLDSLQQRTLLPQATLAVIDLEATVSSGELTVVVIAGEDSQIGTPTLSATAISQTPEFVTVDPTSAPVLVPTCAAAPQGWALYTVQDGDSLASLSIEFGSGIDLLLQANCLAQPQLIPGQVIFLPSSAPTKAVEEVCGAPVGWEQYIVKPGDTLAGLAKWHGTTVVRLMLGNCLEEPQIVPGRKIFLPPASDQRPVRPPGMPMPPAQQAPPHRPPAMKPTATFAAWPTKTVTKTPTKMPWPQATSTATPSVIPTTIFFVTVTASFTPTPLPTSTPVTPPPSLTPEPPYPAKVSSPTATASTTPSPSATITNTPMPTATATSTPSPTATATNSLTATATLEPPATATATATPNPYPYP